METKTFINFLIEEEHGEYDVVYHDHLNPKLWSEDQQLDPEVREALLRIAKEFEDSLEMPTLEVVDIIFTGSMANYNWTDMSDIDLHLVVKEPDQKSCQVNVEEYFLAKKTIWNEHHDVTIYGYPVEVYVQLDTEPHIASGVYSVLHDEWNVEPKMHKPTVDDQCVRDKATSLKHQIDQLIASQADVEAIEKIKERIRQFRRAGLSRAGEFSVENLAFKNLRNTGYLEKLQNYYRQVQDKSLSLE